MSGSKYRAKLLFKQIHTVLAHMNPLKWHHAEAEMIQMNKQYHTYVWLYVYCKCSFDLYTQGKLTYLCISAALSP